MNSIVSVIALVFVFSIIGCGGGGSGSNQTEPPADPGPPPNNEPQPATGGPYVEYFSSNAYLLDLTDYQSAPSPVSANAEFIEYVYTYEYENTTKQAYNMFPALMLYKENNRLWKLDLRENSDLTPVQVSSASLTDMCIDDLFFYESEVIERDLDDPHQALLLYETSGPDNDCATQNDNRRMKVALNDSPTTPPVDVTDLISIVWEIDGIFDSNNIENGVQQIVAVNGNDLVVYDANFENPITIATANSYVDIKIEMYDFARGDGIFLRMDDGLYHYLLNSNSLSNQLLELPTGFSGLQICGGGNCFFSIEELDNTYTLYKLPHDGSSNAVLVAANDSFLSAVTPDYIYYVTNNRTELYRVPKDGGNPVLIDSAQEGIDGLWQVKSSLLYYTKTENGISTAMITDENGLEINSFSNAKWAGETAFYHKEQILLSGISNSSAATTPILGGAGVSVYDPSTGDLISNLGTLPAGTDSIRFNVYQNLVLGDAYLIDLNNTNIVSGQRDLFRADLATSDSLTFITNTPDIDEYISLKH